MSSSRQRQTRIEKKRRRRDARTARLEVAGPTSRPLSQEEEWSSVAMLTPGGRPPAEARVAAFAALGMMSDALLRFMEPYVWWPPAPSELAELEAWLKLGAAVWNATVRATTSSQLREELRMILEQWALTDEEDPAGLVDELAARKLELFPDDYRLVGSVRVFAEGRNATVEAMSVAYLR